MKDVVRRNMIPAERCRNAGNSGNGRNNEGRPKPPRVEVTGLEPARHKGHQFGKLARLPFRHTVQIYEFYVI